MFIPDIPFSWTPSQDPSEAAFAEGINLEHTYPKSMGAEFGLPASDMHHLHPTREDVNQARGNLPFGEILDANAQSWWYLDGNQSNIPGSNIDLYSEVINNDRFEPREDHKGNVARAIFYFYTMYEEDANMANASFFEDQRLTLCDWHLLDPVDQLEYERTYRIATYQDDKPNPFILDCTVALRSYCDHLMASCVVSTKELVDPISVVVQPNPAREQLNLHLFLKENAHITATLYDQLGQEKQHISFGQQASGPQQLQWDQLQLAPGMYHLVIRSDQDGKQQQFVEKVIFQ